MFAHSWRLALVLWFACPANLSAQMPYALRQAAYFGRPNARYRDKITTPDDKFLVGSYRDEVAVFRIADGSRVLSLRINDAPQIYVQGVSSDLRVIALGIVVKPLDWKNRDQALAVWQVDPPRELFRLPPAPPREILRMSPDGKWLAGVNAEGEVEVLDAATGKLAHRVEYLRLGKVEDLDFSDDSGKLSIATQFYESLVNLGDFKFERREWKWDEYNLGRTRNGRQLAFDYKTYGVINSYDRKLLWETPYPPGSDIGSHGHLSLSRDGERLLQADALRRTIEVRDAANGKLIGTLRVPRHFETSHLGMRTLVTTRHSRYLLLDEFIWDLKTCELLPWTNVPESAGPLWFSSDSGLLCLQDSGAPPRFWVYDLKKQHFKTRALPGQVFAFAGRPAEAFTFMAMESRYDGEGQWLGAAAEQKLAGRIERFIAATGQKRWSWRTPPEFSHQASPYGQEAHRIVNAVMTGDQQRVLFANYDDLGILGLATGKARAISREHIGDCNLGPECAVGKGNRALYRDGYRQIALVDHETGREVWRTQLDYPETTRRWRSRSLSISRGPVSAADGKIYVASFSSTEFLDPKTEENTCEIVALDAATGRVLNRFPWVQGDEYLWWPDAHPLAVSPDGSKLALVSPSSVQVMSTQSGKVLAEVTPENVWLSSAAVSPDGQLVAAGGVRGEFWVWKLERRRDSK